MTTKTAGVTQFGSGVGDQHLFRVQGGIDEGYALNQATALMDCVRQMNVLMVNVEHCDWLPATYWLSDMANALIIDVSVGREKNARG